MKNNISSFLLIFLLSGCFFKSSLKEPVLNVPGSIIRSNNSYFVLFSKTYNIFGGCDGKKLNSFNKIELNRISILNMERTFRESYYNYLVGPAENLHPDSTGYLTEFDGETMLVKHVTQQEMICKMKSKFNKTISWDRQYLGFVNSNKDTVLLINLINPNELTRTYLGKEWIIMTDAGLKQLETLSFNLSDSTITEDICNSIK